jgi:hypothetical protein
MLIKWVDAKVRVPSHFYSVVIWVVGGHLHVADDYLDIGCYDPKKKIWVHSGWDYKTNSAEDFEVQVSHWFRPSKPKKSI